MIVVFPDLSGSHPLRHQAGQEDEVQDRVLPAGAAHALSQDVQSRDPLLQRHDLRGRRQGVCVCVCVRDRRAASKKPVLRLQQLCLCNEERKKKKKSLAAFVTA